VVTSGYVAILFGRARATEDIDILVKDVDEEKFKEFWKEVTKHFWCLNA
jgi:predicted nucleotidyltransferase